MSRSRSLLSAFFALVAILVTWGSVSNAQDPISAKGNSEAEFARWVSSLQGGALAVTSTGLAYDAALDRLTIDGLTLTFRAPAAGAEGSSDATSTTLSLRNVQLTGFVTTTDGVFFRSATAEDVALNGSSWVSSAIAATSVELQNVFLPTLKAFIADPKRPISSQVALLRLLSTTRADAIRISDVSAGQGFSAKDMVLSTIARGAVEHIEFKSVVSIQQSGAADPAGQREFSANAVSVSKVDFDPYLRLFEASAYLEAGAARPWRNLIEKIVVSGLVFQGGGMRIASDTVSLDGMKARQFPENITDLFDQAAIDPAFLAGNQEAGQKFATAIRNAFAVDAVSVGSSTVTTKNSEGEVKITAASGLISGLAADRIDAVALEKLDYTDSLRSLQTAAVRLEGVVVPQQMGGSSQSAPSPMVPQVSLVSLSGFQGRIGEAEFALGQFNLDLSYFLSGIPTNLKMSLDNLKLGVNQIADPGIRDTLTAFGYQTVDLSIALAGSWQERSSEIAVENLSLAVAGLGKLSASGSLTGVTRAGIEDPATTLSSEIAAGGLKNFRLSFENEKFFQSFVMELAKQNNRSEDEIRKALAANMPAIMAAVTPVAIKNKLIFAGVAFVNEPTRLDFVSSTVDVVPWKDILAAFSSPAQLPGLLQLDVRANGRQ